MIILSLLVVSLLISLVACTPDAEPDPELESQLAELSDDELAELGETVAEEDDSAVAGQAIRSRYGSKVNVRKSLSRKEIGLIIGEQSKRLKKKTEVPQISIPTLADITVKNPTIPINNYMGCEPTKDEGESCRKHCECTTGICGYDQPIGEDGMPNGPGRMVCETPNERGKSCFEDIECERGLDCEMDGNFMVRGRNADYNSWDNFYDSGDDFVTSKVPICQ